MYNENLDVEKNICRNYKESGENMFLLCVLKIHPDGSDQFTIFNIYRNYSDAEKAAKSISDGTEVPMIFDSIANRYISGSEHICVCKYARTVGIDRVIVSFVVSSPIR